MLIYSDYQTKVRGRREKIRAAYAELIADGTKPLAAKKYLAAKFNVAVATIYNAIKAEK